MINERLRLSIGGTPVQRGFLVVFGAAFTAISAGFVLLPLLADSLLSRLVGGDDDGGGCVISGDIMSDALRPKWAECQPWDGIWSTDGFGTGPLPLLGLCGLPFVLIGLYMILRALRTAAWLDGTRLQVRGALVTRTVDLATADVSASVSTHVSGDHQPGLRMVHRRQELVARDPASGRRVTLTLAGIGQPSLPSHELRALADAMTAGRANDGRHADVHNLADQLRTVASNPLGL